jgi:hypothetical protein
MHPSADHWPPALQDLTAAAETQTHLEADVDVRQPPPPVLHGREGSVPAVQARQEHPTPLVQARLPTPPSVQARQPPGSAIQEWQPSLPTVQEGQAPPGVQAMNSMRSSSRGESMDYTLLFSFIIIFALVQKNQITKFILSGRPSCIRP